MGKTNTKEIDTKTKETTDNLRWYVVHTASGHENKVTSTLRQRIDASGLQDQIAEVLIPTRNKVIIESGKKREIKERLFPGYVLVKMNLNDDTWGVVRNTSGVTGFVGMGAKPTSLPEKEVKAVLKFMKMEAPKFEAKFAIGDSVKIIDGPFTDFLGKVEEIDEEKGKVKVLVSIFGRETPVELDFLQVSPL
jgi:transcriptional antiterminator NusG